jgi:hypothetical protein
MTSRCWVVPSRLTSLTASSFFNSTTVEASSRCVSSSWSRSLDTAICTTGRSEKLNVSTWVSAASGSWMRLIASCTFCSAVAMLVP